VTTRIAASGRLGLPGLLRAPDTDEILAVLAFIALLVDPLLLHNVSHLTPVVGVLAFVTAVPLVARRRFPLGVLGVVVPLLLACLVVFHPNRAAVGIVMLLVFTVGLEGGRARSLVVGADASLTSDIRLRGPRDLWEVRTPWRHSARGPGREAACGGR
jgi:hypothetical protein